MKNKYIVFLLVILIITVALSVFIFIDPKPKRMIRAHDPAGSKVNIFIDCTAWFFDIDDKGEIKSRYGEPKEIKINIGKYVSDPEKADEWIEYFYDGMYALLYYAKASGKRFVYRLTVTSIKYPIEWGLDVGSTKDKVVGVLGKPGKIDKAKNIYTYTNPMENNYVSFHFNGDIVKMIEWDYYLD